MSSIAESFYTYLSTNTTITDELAGTNSIWPMYLPQNHQGFPAIVYSLASDEETVLLNGGRSDSSVAVIQVSIYDNSFETLNDLATIVKSELIGYRGTMGAHTADHIRKEDGGELTLPPETDTGLLGVRLTFRVNYY